MNEKEFKHYYNKIKYCLKNSYNSVYYSKLFNDIGIDFKNEFSYDDFIKIPILSKDLYKKNILDMITNNIDSFNKETYTQLSSIDKRWKYLENHNLTLKYTSGTTGNPLEIIKSKNDVKKDYLTLNLIRNKINKNIIFKKFLWIWPVNPLIREIFIPNDIYRTISKVNNYGYQYMLYEYTDKNFEEMYNFIINNDIKWLSASPSSLVNFSDYIINHHKPFSCIEYIECHSELLCDWQRERIRNAFGIIPYSVYSSNEVQFIAGTNCNEFELFNNCFLEIIDNEIYITSLTNYDIPIIRYRIGDRASWKDNTNFKFELSGCRTNDFIIRKDGVKIEPNILFDLIIIIKSKFDVKIERYRIIQEEYDLFLFYFEENSNILSDKKITDYMIKYLSKILNSKIQIKIFESNSFFLSNIKKHKYFEVSKHLNLKNN